MSERKLNVYFKKEFIGTLIETNGKFLGFEYAKDAKYDLSFALKRTEEPFDRNIVKSFFENLLPEGDVLDLIARAYNVSKNNPFSMLSVIGEDCAGAITISNDITVNSSLPKYLEKTTLESYIESAKKGLSYYQKGMRLSVAGVQNKTTVYIDNENHYFIPNYDFPSTHILKFENSYYPNILLNELICTKLARSLNLPVSNMELYLDDSLEFLKIKRFDRIIKGNKVEKIHVEDFGQISGVLSSNKYEVEGGPSFKDIVKLLRKHSNNAIKDVILLAKILVFNYLIGNNDYHAKNLSMFHEGINKLTPFYDLLSTSVYSELSTDMAMKINNKKDSKDVRKEDVIKEFDSWGLKGSLILSEILKDYKNILVNARDLINTIKTNESEFLENLYKIIEDNYSNLV